MHPRYKPIATGHYKRPVWAIVLEVGLWLIIGSILSYMAYIMGELIN